MMYTNISDRVVKRTRKKHQCAWCGRIIEVGSEAHYRSYIFDDAFQTDYMDRECRDAMIDSDIRDLEYGWSPGDFQRGKNSEESNT